LHGIGSARELDRPCTSDDACRWLPHATRVRSVEALWSAIGSLMDKFSADECEPHIRHAGRCQSG